jgi:hypothetical protein
MADNTVSEQTIVEELHRIPEERWVEVLAFIRSLQPGRQESVAEKPILTAGDLLNSDLIGMWADRTDIGDSREFARRLREQAQTRTCDQ